MASFFRRLFSRRSDDAKSERGKRAPGRDLLEQIQNQFEECDDVKIRRIGLGTSGVEMAIAYIQGITDDSRIEEFTIRPLQAWGNRGARLPGGVNRLEWLAYNVLNTSEARVVDEWEEVTSALVGGDILLMFVGEMQALRVNNRGWHTRGVEGPVHEVTIRGPRDAFSENLYWNTAMIRRRIQDPSLKVKVHTVGRRSRTSVAVLYVEGVTNPGLVEEVQRRLSSIDTDAILDTGYIEQLIEDEWFSPFPQHMKTERPDRAVASLLEGRVVVIADTTPFVLMLPATLDSFFHSPEDSYDRFFPVNFLRPIRFVAAVMAVMMPGLYVALVAYHPGILPTELALRIMTSREGVAFPVLVEAVIMQFFLELIKEAGLRMPGPIGQTFGIVGGLILGEVGIRAGIVSEAMVLTVAATAVASFAAIDREMGTILRLMGLPIMLSAAFFGLFGLIMGVILVGIHISILRSYGVPYFAPYPYYKWTDLKDTIIKSPLRGFHTRPSYLRTPDFVRQRPGGRRAGRPAKRKEEE